MQDEITDAMVVAADVLTVRRIGEERAQRKPIDELVAARQRDRVFVRHVDVRKIQRLGGRRDLEAHVVDRRGDQEVVLEAIGPGDDLLQVDALDVLGRRRARRRGERPPARGEVARRRVDVRQAARRSRDRHLDAPAQRRLRDAFAEVFRGREIALRHLPAAGPRRRHRAEVAAEAVGVVDAGIEAGIRRGGPTRPRPCRCAATTRAG
jgi:hypothetical protein